MKTNKSFTTCSAENCAVVIKINFKHYRHSHWLCLQRVFRIDVTSIYL